MHEKFEFDYRWNDWPTKMERYVSDFPPRIQKDLTTIPLPDSKEFESTYFYGDPGTGKTVKALQMMFNFQRYDYSMMHKKRSTAFITIPELLLAIKDTFSKPDVSETDVINKYSNFEFLVLDDIGTQHTSDWAFQALYIIINRRYENMKYTIYTSNLSLKELEEQLDDARIPSRISQQCEVVKCTEIYRKHKTR